MKYCYSNNGLSFRAVESDYQAQSGEILADHELSPDELAQAFSGYNAAKSRTDILHQIAVLEHSITERMKQEALAGSASTFSSGPYSGKTAAQAIAMIVSQKDALRNQLEQL